MEKERKITVNIGLPIPFIDKLDKKRGQTPRSEVLRNFIIENFDLSKFKAV